MQLKLIDYLKISRPRFWLYTVGTFSVGLLAGATELTQLLSWQSAFLAVYFIIPANLLIYGINDIFDWETDKLNKKKTSYEHLVQPKTHKQLLIAIFLTNIPFLALLPFVSMQSILAIGLFLFFGIFYSAKPIRAKAIPFLDSLFNSLYVFPGLVGYFLTDNTTIPWTAFIGSSLWVFAMHAYSAVPDIQADTAAGVQTIATTLQKNTTLILCTLFYIAATIFGAINTNWILLIFGIPYVCLMILSLQAKNSTRLFSLYRIFPFLNAFTGMILFFFALYDLL